MDFRVETDSLGEVRVPASHLWGAQTQRSLEHFSIGHDLFPEELVLAYATLKKAAALVNHRDGRLNDQQKELIVQVCDEILSGAHGAEFPLDYFLQRSLMLGTALSPVIGYDKTSQVAHYALDHDLTLRDAALKLGFVSAEEFDRIVDPKKMVGAYVAVDTDRAPAGQV